MMNLGLHSEPKDLAREIRRLMLMVPGHADGIALCHGFVEMGSKEFREWGRREPSEPYDSIHR